MFQYSYAKQNPFPKHPHLQYLPSQCPFILICKSIHNNPGIVLRRLHRPIDPHLLAHVQDQGQSLGFLSGGQIHSDRIFEGWIFYGVVSQEQKGVGQKGVYETNFQRWVGDLIFKHFLSISVCVIVLKIVKLFFSSKKLKDKISRHLHTIRYFCLFLVVFFYLKIDFNALIFALGDKIFIFLKIMSLLCFKPILDLPWF